MQARTPSPWQIFTGFASVVGVVAATDGIVSANSPIKELSTLALGVVAVGWCGWFVQQRRRATQAKLRDQAELIAKLQDQAGQAAGQLHQLQEDAYRILVRASEIGTQTFDEKYTLRVTIGAHAAADVLSDCYETTPRPGQSVLYHVVNARSETAARMTPQSQSAFEASGIRLEPSGRLRCLALRHPGDSQDMVGLVIFEPKIDSGTTLTWSMTYGVPGVFDDLRTDGVTEIAVIPSRACTELRVLINLPPTLSRTTCSASRAGGGPNPAQPVRVASGWEWTCLVAPADAGKRHQLRIERQR